MYAHCEARLVMIKYVKNASSDLVDDNNDASAINAGYEYIQLPRHAYI